MVKSNATFIGYPRQARLILQEKNKTIENLHKYIDVITKENIKLKEHIIVWKKLEEK